jgi:hypothetical protein
LKNTAEGAKFFPGLVAKVFQNLFACKVKEDTKM